MIVDQRLDEGAILPSCRPQPLGRSSVLRSSDWSVSCTEVPSDDAKRPCRQDVATVTASFAHS